MRLGLRDVDAVEYDGASGGAIDSVHDVERCRFSGTIRPDQRMHGPGCDFDIDAVHRFQATEVLLQILQFQDRTIAREPHVEVECWNAGYVRYRRCAHALPGIAQQT